MTITATQHYLTFPIRPGFCERDDLRMVTVKADGETIYRFLLPPYGPEGADRAYRASIDIAPWQGQTLEVTSELGEAYDALIGQSNTANLAPVQAERPAFHYTAPYGWINDPNGMVYANGVWHLYYQHNPMNTEWMNMSWGHAVSTDLVHYTYVSDVMHPDQYGTIFSGCGLVNDHECFGLPKDALLFFYSAARDSTRLSAEHMTHRMAYSLDGGRTLIKYPDWQLPCLAEENRDPKIAWYDEFGCYIIVLYLENNDFGIFRSTDLEHWEQTQTVTIPPMWECPDFFPLMDESGRRKWAFVSADGYYVLGDFDGHTFTQTSELMDLYGGEDRPECTSGKLPYAAQSFSNAPDGRVIAIAWLRIPNRGTCYTGAMSLPREFTLDEDENGMYIRQQFVPEAAEYVIEDDLGSHVTDSYIQESISEDGRFYTAEIIN